MPAFECNFSQDALPFMLDRPPAILLQSSLELYFIFAKYLSLLYLAMSLFLESPALLHPNSLPFCWLSLIRTLFNGVLFSAYIFRLFSDKPLQNHSSEVKTASDHQNWPNSSKVNLNVRGRHRVCFVSKAKVQRAVKSQTQQLWPLTPTIPFETVSPMPPIPRSGRL